MSIYKGSARLRFYFDGRSHTLACHHCILQIVAPSSSDGHRGSWSAIGVFVGADGSSAPVLSFQAAFAEHSALEGIFCMDADTAGTSTTTLSGLVTVARSLPVDTALNNEVNKQEGVRLVLAGRDTPRIAQETSGPARPAVID